MTKQCSEHPSTQPQPTSVSKFLKKFNLSSEKKGKKKVRMQTWGTLCSSDCTQLFNLWQFLFPIKLIAREMNFEH